MLTSRAAFASLPPLSLPPPPIPHPSVPLPSPSPIRTPSRPIPRSPYVNISPQRLSRNKASASASAPTSPHDVLSERDIIGPGLRLQGELIRPVCAPLPIPSQAFEVVRKLGSGSYAVVYLVREILSPIPSSSHSSAHDLVFGDDLDLDVPPAPTLNYGQEFAVKCLSKANLNRDALDAQLFEATVHQSLPQHPNIVTLHRTFETDSFLLLLLECVPGEDLFYFLEQSRDADADADADDAGPDVVPSVTPPTPSLLSSLHPAQLLHPQRLRLIASMFAQMCDAVAKCHSVNVFHRDIKPENFIVTDGWAAGERKVVVKLTDFGLATTEQDSADMDCGSAPYMSYECRNNCAPTYSTRAADVWSLGIVLINMLYHHNPWSDTTAGACPSFEAFRAQPVSFFMHRFPGMTRPVADFLATRIFCILDSPGASRASAAEFGRWVRSLPALLAPQAPPASAVPTTAPLARLPRVASTPRSRRPSSRPPSRGPASAGPDSRAPSPSHFALAEPDLPEAEEDAADVDACSRTTSTARRRKRGARKGRGAHPDAAAPEDPLAALAAASQVLAREISQASRKSKSPARAAAVPPAKKPSKWKGVFRMGAPDDNDGGDDGEDVPPLPVPSATAANVSTLIMGLSPTPPRTEWRGRRAAGSGSTGANSSNWRTASTASSSGSSFTRFSNGSVRSVSTVATSVSAAESWRAPTREDANKKQKPPLPAPPANLKLISGVPWELHELPRGCHVRPHEHVFSPPPPSRLDTISEPTTEGDAEDGGAAPPKKVQRGQINTLAKMLSALKANRGAH